MRRGGWRGGVWCRGVPPDPKLPEEFAPTGPKLTRFQMRPAPPIRPRLFPDEARFALRLAVLAGATEFAAWAWLLGAGHRPLVLVLAALRLFRPFWASAGTRSPRPLVGGALIALSLAAIAAAFVSRGALLPMAAVAAALPSLGDLCASCVGDNVTVERRAAAFVWLDMAQALGAAAAVALTGARPSVGMLATVPVLLVGCVGLRELRDRGTPRSTWPFDAYASAARAPLVAQLALTASLCALLAAPRASDDTRPALTWSWLLLLAGMAIASRVEPRLPNAIWLPRIALALAAIGAALGFAPVRAFALGMMLAAIPASVARGAGEMERPLASSWAFSALFAGAAVGGVLGS